MTPRQMQDAFEKEVYKMDSPDMVESHLVFHWINEAILQYVKAMYSGANPEGTSVEQTQRRVEDLRTLVKEESINTSIGDIFLDMPNSYLADLPLDYLFKLSEEVLIEGNSPDYSGMLFEKRTGIVECTSDNYLRKLQDPHSEHILHYEEAMPLRLFRDHKVQLITDGTYAAPVYFLRYIKYPNKVSLESDDCELPEHTHPEIVNLAVGLFLQSRGNPRRWKNQSELNNPNE